MNKIQRTLLAFAVAALASTGALADNVRLILKGHDPVAYFTEGKPTKGDPRYAYDFDEARYHFASAKHREMFAANPEKYAPQFGGYCTGSMARGVRNEGDPNAWVIRDGRLYVFGNTGVYDTMAKESDYMEKRLPNATKNWKAAKSS
jgi:YHS domain-containing protein